MYKEFIKLAKKDLGLTDDTKDEVLELYFVEGEKQLLRHFNATKLTSTLMVIVKGYVVAKMRENSNKYNSCVERHSGLDNYFKESGFISTQSRFNNKMQNSLHAVKKQKTYTINKSIESGGKKHGKSY